MPIAVNPPKNVRGPIGLIVGVALIIAASGAFAQNLPFSPMQDWGPTTWNMGGASSASASDYDSVVTNPGGLVYYNHKSSFGGHWQQLPDDQSQWVVSSIDGNQNIITGFQFAWLDVANTTRQDFTLSVAYPTEYGAIGVGVQAQRLKGVSINRGWHTTTLAGILAPVAYGFSFGAYSKSFSDFSDDSKYPPTVHMGIMYSVPESLRIAFDADRRFKIHHQDWNYSMGADVLMKDYFGLRGGYHWDASTEYDFWSVGGSIVSPKMELSGYFMRRVSGVAENGMGFKAEVRF